VTQYVVVHERTSTSYGAYVPDLPGCVATGKTLDAVRKLIREAIAFHIEGMRLGGEPVPEPSAAAELVDVTGAAAKGI
jgi:predicted RNase H-like HicB family nuclease